MTDAFTEKIKKTIKKMLDLLKILPSSLFAPLAETEGNASHVTKPKSCQTEAKQGTWDGFRCVWTKSTVLRTYLRVVGGGRG